MKRQILEELNWLGGIGAAGAMAGANICYRVLFGDFSGFALSTVQAVPGMLLGLLAGIVFRSRRVEELSKFVTIVAFIVGLLVSFVVLHLLEALASKF